MTQPLVMRPLQSRNTTRERSSQQGILPPQFSNSKARFMRPSIRTGMEMDTEMNETLVLDDKALPAEGATQAPSTIIEKVEQFVRRFVFFKDDSLYRLVALWIVATHLHSAFEYTGYLFAYSARPQSGKSRLLEVLDLL